MACCWLALLVTTGGRTIAAAELRVGLAQVDITPNVASDKPVWLAGFVPGREANGIHDRLWARSIVLDDGTQKLAFVSVDLVGLQHPVVEQIRLQLPDYRYVAVASTHNHEGPDVIGIWGPTMLKCGVDDQYIAAVRAGIIESIRLAERRLDSVIARFGTASAPHLLADSRLPTVRDGVLRVLRFVTVDQKRTVGLLVQWNCHPEALGPNNTLISADFPAYAIRALQDRHHCPVVYVSGAIGGLIAPPRQIAHQPSGMPLRPGTYAYTEQYGQDVAQVADQAIARSLPIDLTPFQVATKSVGIPVTNRLYRLGRLLGVMQRDGFLWYGPDKPLGAKVTRKTRFQPSAIRTEVACVRLGQLHIAMIPGELYPELVYGDIVDPSATGADFPDAPPEPCVAKLIGAKNWMLFGLANDEIGYIIPKRQWDRRAPYTYGRSTAQYGEINSCGPDTAPIVMRALKSCVDQLGDATLPHVADQPASLAK